MMAKNVLAAVLAVLSILALTGCIEWEKDGEHLMSAKPEAALKADVAPSKIEAAHVEKMSDYRQKYYKALEELAEFYDKSGNYLKSEWARKELYAVRTMPRYRYIIEAEVAGPSLRATDVVQEANDLYAEAMADYKKAKELILIVDDKLMRVSLNKFNELIKTYPTSDKIDDAAFTAGKIYEHFKDYEIAVLYFKRAFQWDAETPHAARFKAAYILDRRLRRRGEALELYRQSLEIETQHTNYNKIAQERIDYLTAPKPGQDVEAGDEPETN